MSFRTFSLLLKKRPISVKVLTRNVRFMGSRPPSFGNLDSGRNIPDLKANEDAGELKSSKPRHPADYVSDREEGRSYFAAITMSLLAGGSIYFMFKTLQKALHYQTGNMDDEPLEPPHHPWDYQPHLKSYDHASLRRGLQVYQEVCATCHSLFRVYFRELVDVTHTKAQAKQLAANYDIEAGPNDEGDMFIRPGTLLDPFPNPYKNDEFARSVNGGALPPDLSLVAITTHAEESYVFALLTGYNEPPHGINLQEGKHWNSYFEGGWISMPPPLLADGLVDYEDGTPATKSQMAKDVSTFLMWCGDRAMDERKLKGLNWCSTLAILIGMLSVWKQYRWLPIKTEMYYFKR
eukprot:118442_1